MRLVWQGVGACHRIVTEADTPSMVAIPARSIRGVLKGVQGNTVVQSEERDDQSNQQE